MNPHPHGGYTESLSHWAIVGTPGVPYLSALFLPLEEEEAVTEFKQKDDLIMFELQKDNSAM